MDPAGWVRELSRYDAGWRHRIASRNGGDLRRATWDDLNSPARMPALLMAGLPLLLPDNHGHRVAVNRVTAAEGTGITYHASSARPPADYRAGGGPTRSGRRRLAGCTRARREGGS